MAQYGISYQSGEFDQGGPASYYDPQQTIAGQTSAGLLIPNLGLYAVPGTSIYWNDSKGRLLKFVYVILESTVAIGTPTVGFVYWKGDLSSGAISSYTIVTANSTEAVNSIGIVALAGVLLNSAAAGSADNNGGVWIQTYGYLGSGSDTGFGTGFPKGASSPSNFAVGVPVIPTANTAGTQGLPSFLAATSTAIPSYYAGYVITAPTGNVNFDMFIKIGPGY